MKGSLLFALVLAQASGLQVCTRRAALLGAGVALLPKQAHASYALGVANVEAHSWEATGKDKERKVYNSIDANLDEKRRYRDEAGTLGYVGGEYTSYRRGAARDEFEAKKKQTGPSGYMTAEELMVASQARRIATP